MLKTILRRGKRPSSASMRFPKNRPMQAERNVAIEDIVCHIMVGSILDTFEHPNQERYQG
jgi:hypothetical protein